MTINPMHYKTIIPPPPNSPETTRIYLEKDPIQSRVIPDDDLIARDCTELHEPDFIPYSLPAIPPSSAPIPIPLQVNHVWNDVYFGD